MTNLNHVAIRCMDNPTHQMLKEADGIRCFICDGPTVPIPVTEELYDQLPSYSKLRKKYRHPKSKALSVDINTDKLQLKLRAIGKHIEALSKEIEVIDKAEPCIECGSICYEENKVYPDNSEDNPFYWVRECADCGHSIELPTRLEGSE